MNKSDFPVGKERNPVHFLANERAGKRANRLGIKGQKEPADVGIPGDDPIGSV